jgi:iron complex transport system substrate-binding protein
MWLQGTKYAGHYYEPLGLKPPEQANGDGAELSLEGLTKINPDYIFLGYFNYTDKSLPALADEWEKTDVWKSLKAVKANHYTRSMVRMPLDTVRSVDCTALIQL